MLAMLTDAHDAGQLKFFNTHAGLADKKTFKRFIAPLRRIKWVVCCRRLRGPEHCCLSFSLHPRRRHLDPLLITADEAGIAFRWKDYRIDGPGRGRRCGFTRTSHPAFLLHVLPKGFRRIRRYRPSRRQPRRHIATARAFLDVARLLSTRDGRRISHRTRRVRCTAHARIQAAA